MGLRPGQPLADARALVPELTVAMADADVAAAALTRLADAAEAFTPAVASDAAIPALLLDIAGATHFWASADDAPDAAAAAAEARLAAAAIRRIGALGFTARAGLAATPDAAAACAIYGCDAADIGLLPVAALRLDADSEAGLARAGLRTVGAVAARPRGALAARFGAALVDRIDRLLGRVDARITPRRRAPPITAARNFAQPIAHLDTVRLVLAELLGDLARQLAARGRGGRRFAVRFDRSDGAQRHIAIDTAAATRDGALIARLLDEHLDGLADPLDPGFGFDAMLAAAVRHEPLADDQLTLMGGTEHGAAQQAAMAELIDRLGARWGPQMVKRLAPHASHIPEQAALLLPVTSAAPAPAADWPQPEAGEPPLRPFHLFDPPQLVEVIAEVPDGPPRQFRWRRRLHHIRRHDGPERIAPEWWRRPPGQPQPPTRDYYRVEDASGRRFWMFRHGLYGSERANPRWYIHGLFA